MKRKAVLGKVVSTLILSKTKPTEHNLVPYEGCFSMKDLLLCFTYRANKIYSGSQGRISWPWLQISGIAMTLDIRSPQQIHFTGLFLSYCLYLGFLFLSFLLSMWVIGIWSESIDCLPPPVLQLHQYTFGRRVDSLVKLHVSWPSFGSIVHDLLYLPICNTFRTVSMIK